jgi:hypothetical protein
MPSLPGVAQGTLAFIAEARSKEFAAEHDFARCVPVLDKLRGMVGAPLVSLL